MQLVVVEPPAIGWKDLASSKRTENFFQQRRNAGGRIFADLPAVPDASFREIASLNCDF